MGEKIMELGGANMDIDLISNPDLHWKQDKCPWSEKDGKEHKCAVKNVSLCKYFKGIEKEKPGLKKIIVTLKKGQKIEITGNK